MHEVRTRIILESVINVLDLSINPDAIALIVDTPIMAYLLSKLKFQNSVD